MLQSFQVLLTKLNSQHNQHMEHQKVTKQTVLIVAIFATCFMILVNHYTQPQKLYIITDKYVDKFKDDASLSYGLFSDQNERTTDEYYRVGLIGRRILVKIIEYADEKEYDKLEKNLARRYNGKETVNEVFENAGGTITIDCRN